MPVEEVPDRPSVPVLALHEQGGGTAPAAAEEGRVTRSWVTPPRFWSAVSALPAGPGVGGWPRRPSRGYIGGSHLPDLQVPRTSGSDMATSSPRAMLATAACLGTGSQPKSRRCERHP
jgi:hypothetical protein